ncbi:MAG: 50S ribosome-binding GTPase [Planctomycetia bacterium]|nr:50S ribosome-binding GTPase [Planctomycetia bacterium]
MSRWRIAVITVLVAVPLLVLLSLGSYFLWKTGYGLWVWLPMSACVGVGWFLAWYWLRQRSLLPRISFAPPVHWTDRDKQAMQLVEARAEELARQGGMQFQNLETYARVSQDLALELAKFYHPQAQDPFSSLTVPEILTVVELAAHDLAELVDQNVPGSHLLSVNDWRWTKEAADKATNWYRQASNAFWLLSAVFNPIETGVRYLASRAGTTMPLQMLQQDLVAWFHVAFIHRLGSYLIDLNSGRLKVGAQRFRDWQRKATGAEVQGSGAVGPDGKPVEVVTLAIFGQTKVGKSSFVNAVLGEQKARTDVLPATDEITRYQLPLAGSNVRLLLLDTVGYGHQGPKADQMKATQDAAQQADVMILVLHARNPARQADLAMLEELKRWFASRPDLKMPPVLAVVTHIDLLTPAMEWAPPYNWQQPTRLKEKQIQEALTAVRDQLGTHLDGAVPVCTSVGKVYGIEEWFLPTLTELLGEARSVSLLRCLRAEFDTGKVRKVFHQLAAAGGQVLQIWAQKHFVPPRKEEATPAK